MNANHLQQLNQSVNDLANAVAAITGIRVTRLLVVVEYRQPQIIAMFPAISPETAQQLVAPKETIEGGTADGEGWKYGGPS